MAAPMKTPGVYIVEKNAFPNSVVEVATAVPAFVGYTRKADNKGRSLAGTPWLVTSMAEFEQYFGGAPALRLGLAGTAARTPAPATGEADEEGGPPPGGGARAPAPGSGVQSAHGGDPFGVVLHPAGGGPAARSEYRLTATTTDFQLHRAMKLFFSNGGSRCYVVSVGSYAEGDSGRDDARVEKKPLLAGIEALKKEQEPTMLLVPDAQLLSAPDCAEVQQAMLMHCGYEMRNRVAILDLKRGDRPRSDDDPVQAFREAVGSNHLDFGVAYYPWLRTTVVDASELDPTNLDADARSTLRELIARELGLDGSSGDDPDGARKQAQKAEVDRLQEDLDALAASDPDAVRRLHKALFAMSGLYRTVMKELREHLNVLPPGPALAGIYTMVDNSIGVWKAPANVSVATAVAPTVSISQAEQEDLNVTPQGKSVNAIRAFTGEGTLVWGARTLDGNSLDWRYVNVRRTMIMLEESIRLAAKAYVFEPNVANTWVTVKSMIRNFLTGIWKRGGLAGATPDEAFGVFVGLGETMTPDDILEGIMRVTVLVAITRPAEFIEITFQQKMQES